MKKTQQQVFLEVKQKLDYYQLPTIFPYESVDLLQQLLSLLDKHARRDGKQNKQSNPNSNFTEINDSLRHEIGKVVRENNRLHMELMSAKEEIMTLKHSNDKLLIERSGGSKEISMLVQVQRKRQDQLFDQLTRVKFKYNQLMDLVHEDSEIEKKYIKRLMKHKKMDLTDKNLSQLPISEIKKGPHQTVTDLQAKIILLQNKIANRQAQIMRLQKRSQYDGLNMNKILKDFQNHRTDNKISALEQQVNYLEEQNKKMKQEVNYVRKNGGSKEALREEMRKNHETITKLSGQNKQLRKKLKMKDFDVAAYEIEGGREINKAKNESYEKQEAVDVAGNTIDDLKKKVNFYKKELEVAKAAIEKEQKNNTQLQVLVDKFQNLEAGERILAQYELQSLKQKLQQYEAELETKKQRLGELKAENDYHKQEDKLKNEAIENLQKIVDELMRRNNQNDQREHNLSEHQSLSLENTIALRKNLVQMKQQLASCLNDKEKVERDFQTLIVRFDQKSKDNVALNDELNRLKIKVIEMKNAEEQFSILQRQVATLQSDLKKQQNFRYKIDQMHQEAENDKTRLRKQLQQLTQQFQIYERKSKNHLNSLKMQVNQLQENKQMMELITKEKDKKILILQSHVQQLGGKIKLLKQQIATVEDEKLNAIRQRHKYEKRCEEMLKVNTQTHSLNRQEQQLRNNSLHSQILEYQHEVKKLHDRINIQNEQIRQLNSYCQAMKLSQENLMQEKAMLKRQAEKLRNVRSREGISSDSAQEE